MLNLGFTVLVLPDLWRRENIVDLSRKVLCEVHQERVSGATWASRHVFSTTFRFISQSELESRIPEDVFVERPESLFPYILPCSASYAWTSFTSYLTYNSVYRWQ